MTNDPNPVLPSSPGVEPFEGGHGRPGELALVGGSEWSEGCETFDQELLQASGTREVLVLPTAAAYWHPERAVETAASYFSEFGASVKGCMVLRRADAEDKSNAGTVRAARFIYLAGGSVLHLRSVLKASAVWEALVEAWTAGAVLAGSSAGAMVLGDTMVDPRGGAPHPRARAATSARGPAARQQLDRGEAAPYGQARFRGPADRGHRRANGAFAQLGRALAPGRPGGRHDLVGRPTGRPRGIGAGNIRASGTLRPRSGRCRPRPLAQRGS